MENLAAVLHGKRDLRLEAVPVPEPKEGEVLVAIKKCGICRTDIHMWQEGGCGDFRPEEPIIIGHECSGQVVAIGPAVNTLKVGDRVALELGLPCLHCDLCRSGHYNLCKPFSLGGLTRYHAYPEIFCHKFPDHVSDEEGALIEPLAVAVRACRRGAVTLGHTVLIGGSGPIGLSCLLAARAMGAATICITDVSSARLELAKRMGADHTVVVEPGQSVSDLCDVVLSATGQIKPDVVLETSGAQQSLHLALLAIRPSGCLVPVALDPPEVTLPLIAAVRKEVDIHGTFSYGPNDYPKAIAMVASGKVDPKPMITQRYDLEDTLNACELGKKASDNVIKIMINCEKK